VWEEELMRREEVLTLQEKEAKTSKGAIVKVSADLDAEWAKAEAT
jgi:predicted ATPase